ncbi:cysteine-rich protein 1-like [Poeciliopsis prolifica]|uniref:cysteine-rich protein 1-like n=1 Tax=Poeciliopsis prolifica TaxID=188132 RepID=UPI002413AC74|nr:cysteine-rich protein 1-like [Poeciliopsis prolifica]
MTVSPERQGLGAPKALKEKEKGEKKRSLGRDYHPLCLKCQKCNRQLTAGQHAEYDEKPYCTHCYLKMFGPRCTLSGSR